MALSALGDEVLHASGIVGPHGVVALCAESETGKSTLAYALSRRGYAPWADDAVSFRIDGNANVESFPLPFAIRLRAAPAARFGRGNGRDPVTLEHLAPLDDAVPAPIAAICVLERVQELRGDEPVVVERLRPTAAFPLVLAHAYCYSDADIERNRLMIVRYLRLVAHVPTFRVHLTSTLDRLDQVVDVIRRSVIESVRASA